MRLLPALLASMAALSCLSGPARDPLAPRLEAVVRALAKEDRFSGTVLVAQQGRVVYAGAFGEANRDHQVPNGLHTRYNIGSIGKTFTALAVMQLVQAGRLKLGDPLGRVLPDCPYPEKDSITIQHLLNHSSGLSNYMQHADYLGRMNRLRAIRDVLPLIWSQKPAFRAGERFQYSNSGMVVLGAVVEKVSGLGYPEYLDRHIFGPAGMKETGLQQEEDVLPHRAIGYQKTPKGYVANVNLVPPAFPDGGLRTTVGDLLKFDQALLGSALLDEAHKRIMFTPVGPDPFHAQGWVVRPGHAGRRAIGHTGGTVGVSAAFERFVDDGITLIVLSNGGEGAVEVAQALAGVLFPGPPGAPAPGKGARSGRRAS